MLTPGLNRQLLGANRSRVGGALVLDVPFTDNVWAASSGVGGIPCPASFDLGFCLRRLHQPQSYAGEEAVLEKARLYAARKAKSHGRRRRIDVYSILPADLPSMAGLGRLRRTGWQSAATLLPVMIFSSSWYTTPISVYRSPEYDGETLVRSIACDLCPLPRRA